LGHAAQALGNLMPSAEDSFLGSSSIVPEAVRLQAIQAASDILKTKSGELKPVWVFKLLDEYVLQYGKEGDREVFIYREGFYRGAAVALFFLSGTLVIRMLIPGSSLALGQEILHFSWREIVFTAIIAA